jgi:hypothetical protein
MYGLSADDSVSFNFKLIFLCIVGCRQVLLYSLEYTLDSYMSLLTVIKFYCPLWKFEFFLSIIEDPDYEYLSKSLT